MTLTGGALATHAATWASCRATTCASSPLAPGPVVALVVSLRACRWGRVASAPAAAAALVAQRCGPVPVGLSASRPASWGHQARIKPGRRSGAATTRRAFIRTRSGTGASCRGSTAKRCCPRTLGSASLPFETARRMWVCCFVSKPHMFEGKWKRALHQEGFKWESNPNDVKWCSRPHPSSSSDHFYCIGFTDRFTFVMRVNVEILI